MLLRCSSLCLIISDCTLSCLCLMVEEQITEGSLSESWWSAPVTDWDQWSWQRRASGGTLHNRQQELHPALETLSSHSSPQSPMFRLSNCLATLHWNWNWHLCLSFEGHRLCCSRDPLSAFSSDGKVLFILHVFMILFWHGARLLTPCYVRLSQATILQNHFTQWE